MDKHDEGHVNGFRGKRCYSKACFQNSNLEQIEDGCGKSTIMSFLLCPAILFMKKQFRSGFLAFLLYSALTGVALIVAYFILREFA